MMKKTNEHKLAKKYLNGIIEQSHYFKWGVDCRCRPDCLEPVDKWISDLKTIREIKHYLSQMKSTTVIMIYRLTLIVFGLIFHWKTLDLFLLRPQLHIKLKLWHLVKNKWSMDRENLKRLLTNGLNIKRQEKQQELELKVLLQMVLKYYKT